MLLNAESICSPCSAVNQFLSHCFFRIEILGHSYRPVEQQLLTSLILEFPFEGETTETNFMLLNFRGNFGLTQEKKTSET